MFTSNNSCDNNIDDDDDQTMFENRPFENDISPNYKPADNLSFSFFHFSPSTFFDQDDAFFQNHLLSVVDSPDSITTMAEHYSTQTTTKKAVSDDDPSKVVNPPNNYKMMKNNMNTTTTTTTTRSCRIPKRRLAGKKDRHSKIVTAQGPRDRRMRLSLPIARQFFSLQDMLGVDKPSKTVQWLLTMSKSAIDELTLSFSKRGDSFHVSTGDIINGGGGGGGCKSGSSMSECEVVSEIEEAVTYNQEERRSKDLSKGKGKSLEGSSSPNPPNRKGKKMIRPSTRKTTYHPLARESRAKARERARERTIEKMHSQTIIDKSKQLFPENPNNLKKVRYSLTSSSKKGEESAGSGSYDMKSSSEMVSDEVIKHNSQSVERQGSTVKDNINVLEDSFMVTRKSSPSSIFSYHDDIGLIGSNNNNNKNNNNINDSTSTVLNFSEIWDFTNNAATNTTYCAITNMNLPAGNAHDRLPSSSNIPLSSPNTRLQSQFANIPQFYGKP